MCWVARRNKWSMSFSTCILFFGKGYFNLGILNSRQSTPPPAPPNSMLMSRAEKNPLLPKNTEIVVQVAESQVSCILGFKKPSISWPLQDRGRVGRRGSLLKPGVSCLLFLAGVLPRPWGEFPVVVVHFWPKSLVHQNLFSCSHDLFFLFVPFSPSFFLKSSFFPAIDCVFVFCQNSYVEAPTPMGCCLQMGSLGGNWIWMRSWGGTLMMTLVPTEEGEETRALWAMWRYSEKVVVYKPGNGSSLESDHAGTLILDLQSPELWQINVSWLSHPGSSILLQQPEQIRHFPSQAFFLEQFHYHTISKMFKKLCIIPAFGSQCWINRMLSVFIVTVVELPWPRNEHSYLPLAEKREHFVNFCWIISSSAK